MKVFETTVAASDVLDIIEQQKLVSAGPIRFELTGSTVLHADFDDLYEVTMMGALHDPAIVDAFHKQVGGIFASNRFSRIFEVPATNRGDRSRNTNRRACRRQAARMGLRYHEIRIERGDTIWQFIWLDIPDMTGLMDFSAGVAADFQPYDDYEGRFAREN